jgi:hypothetical protein
MAGRRLRVRWNYYLGLDGNLHLSGESLRSALANTHGDCNGYGYGYCNCYGHAYCYRGAEA